MSGRGRLVVCEGRGTQLSALLGGRGGQGRAGTRVHATSLARGSRSEKSPLTLVLFCSPNEWLVEKIFPKAQPGLTWYPLGWRKRGGPFFWGPLGFCSPYGYCTSLAGRVQGRDPSPSPASLPPPLW